MEEQQSNPGGAAPGTSDPHRSDPLSRRARLLIALAIAIGSAALVEFYMRTRTGVVRDFDLFWWAAVALRSGMNPYDAIGPGRWFEYGWPLHYPLTAVLAVLPLSYLPLGVARALFFGLSSGALGYFVAGGPRHRLLLFASLAFVMNAFWVQWTPSLMAAVYAPWLGVLFSAKPTLGAALWAMRPTWRAAAGAALLTALSVAVRPGWAGDWLAAVQTGPQRAPVMIGAGALMLLVLVRWRRPEARFLAVLACVPHSPALPTALMLFLVPQTVRESALMVALTCLVYATSEAPRYASDVAYFHRAGLVTVTFLYLPAVAMVLRRPNEGDVPAVVERALAAVRSWLARVTRPSW